MAPRVIKNANQIVEGIKTDYKKEHGTLKEEEVNEINRRRTICDNCPYLDKHAKQRNGEYEKLIRITELKNGIDVDENIDLSYKSVRPDDHCTLCGCNKEYKTSCLSCSCGIVSFNEEQGMNLEPKWLAFTN